MSTRCALIVAVALAGSACGGGGPADPNIFEDGAVCQRDSQCRSNHCGGAGFCCSAGDCCATADDCVALGYQKDSTCAVTGSATDCQGTAQQATCEGWVCGSKTIPDDGGCAGQVHDCDKYQAITCTSSADQPVAACAGSCTTKGDCAPGYTCGAGNTCVEILGAGADCRSDPTVCANGLKCQNGVCCDATAQTCCTSDPAYPTTCPAGMACNTTTSTCFTNCGGDDAKCGSTSLYCNSSGACVTKLADGIACGSGNQCQHGHCVDGVCCATGCSGCQACNVTGHVGTCTDNSTRCGSVCQTCVSGACVNKTDGSACSDGCKGGMTCAGGACTGGCTCSGMCVGDEVVIGVCSGGEGPRCRSCWWDATNGCKVSTYCGC